MLRIRLLRLRVVLAVAILIAVIASNRHAFGRFSDGVRYQASFKNTPAPVVTTTHMVGDASKVFQKVNSERRVRKLKPLRWNETLSELATEYSKQMAEEEFFSHYDPEGKTIVDRADEFDITDWKKIGENLFIGKGYPDVSTVAVKSWMKSQSHKKNILDYEWTHTGVGVFKTSDNRTFITQVFMTK